jgi:hypothetical protein
MAILVLVLGLFFCTPTNTFDVWMHMLLCM